MSKWSCVNPFPWAPDIRREGQGLSSSGQIQQIEPRKLAP